MKPIPTEKTPKEAFIEAIQQYNDNVMALIEAYYGLYNNTFLLAYVALVGAIYLLFSLINYFY